MPDLWNYRDTDIRRGLDELLGSNWKSYALLSGLYVSVTLKDGTNISITGRRLKEVLHNIVTV